MQYLLLVFATVLAFTDCAEKPMQPRVLPIVSLVRFENYACTGSDRTGTCYTTEECENKGGAANGACAEGYGVCCVFVESCGGKSSENCTYFTNDNLNTNNEATTCKLDVCPCEDHICQLRLDFTTFVIAAPETAMDTVAKSTFGQFAADGAPVSLAGQCLTDSFSVTSSGFTAPSTICGTNTGQHMYVDAGPSQCECNTLKFLLGAGTQTRMWNIKITQYSCKSPNLAPQGCTQYFTTSTGTIESFNYNSGNGRHLANQKQNVCIRREDSNCRICFAAAALTDVQISAGAVDAMCANYGADGASASGGLDYINIAQGQGKTTSAFQSIFCGSGGGLRVADNTGKTVCTTRQPFNLQILTDNFELIGGETGTQAGVRLSYAQDVTNCPNAP